MKNPITFGQSVRQHGYTMRTLNPIAIPNHSMFSWIIFKRLEILYWIRMKPCYSIIVLGKWEAWYSLSKRKTLSITRSLTSFLISLHIFILASRPTHIHLYTKRFIKETLNGAGIWNSWTG